VANIKNLESDISNEGGSELERYRIREILSYGCGGLEK
jgi:hypothetical protein